MERRIATLAKDRDEWERKAEFAMSRDREDLARGALLAKAQAARLLEAVRTQLGHVVEALAARDADIGQLQAKLADARGREQALLTRKDTAEARLKLRARIHDGRVGDAFARFETVERALDQMEGKVEAYDLGRRRTLADEFVDLEAEQTVQDELAALKARLKPQAEGG